MTLNIRPGHCACVALWRSIKVSCSDSQNVTSSVRPVSPRSFCKSETLRLKTSMSNVICSICVNQNHISDNSPHALHVLDPPALHCDGHQNTSLFLALFIVTLHADVPQCHLSPNYAVQTPLCPKTFQTSKKPNTVLSGPGPVFALDTEVFKVSQVFPSGELTVWGASTHLSNHLTINEMPRALVKEDNSECLLWQQCSWKLTLHIV